MTKHFNIVLTGFMGTGKTAVGKVVSERLGRYFIDMDTIIEQRAARPISTIFDEDGERVFRQMEAELCRELAGERDIVIATGGGALLSGENLGAMAQSGVVICLNAEPAEIVERLRDASDRPLLASLDREKRIVSLLLERAEAYREVPYQIDTSGLGVAEVAEQVIRLFRDITSSPVRIPVTTPGGSYDILVRDGLLAETGHLMREAGIRPGACMVVTNPEIGAAHARILVAGLEEAGYAPAVVEIPEGEIHKTLDTVATLYDRFLERGLDRQSPVIALGGGVVGDVAGFAGATYLRGVPLVQIPTSLLAMVDSSVGGKTGVDMPQGKNLVGAFKQPELVVIDPEVLATLPPAEFRSGLGEVVKHGIIGAPALFEMLEGNGFFWGPSSLGDLVADAVRVKVAVVEADPFEGGRRAVLNLGHTFGHALEVVSDYQLRHGEAVGIGLAAAVRLAARLELCDSSLIGRIEDVLCRLGLPIRFQGSTPEQIIAAMATDKKRVGQQLRFVLPRAIGDVDLFDDVPEADVRAVLDEILR